MATKLPLKTAIEIWQKYGAYLIGVRRIAVDYPEVSFQQFMAALQEHATYGHWSREALQRAWNGI